MVTFFLIAALAMGQSVESEPPVFSTLKWLSRHQDADGSWGRIPDKCGCIKLPALDSVAPDPKIGPTVEPLIAALGAATLEARSKAVADLRKIGMPAAPYLIDAAKPENPDAEQRSQAASVLESIRRGLMKPDPEATALALLAFFGAGYSHLSDDVHEGVDFGAIIRNGLKWTLSTQDKEGRYGAPPVAGGVSTGNVLSLVAVLEAYRLTGSEFLKAPGQSGIGFLVSKKLKDGSWGPGQGDPAATMIAMCAARAAKLGDLTCPAAVLAGTGDWLRARTAKGTAADHAAAILYKIWFTAATKASIEVEALAEIAPALLDPVTRSRVALALFTAQGREGAVWKKWSALMREAVAGGQRKEGCAKGSFNDGPAAFTEAAANALSLQVLSLYHVK